MAEVGRLLDVAARQAGACREAADQLAFLHAELEDARAPAYDVHTALHVLQTGTEATPLLQQQGSEGFDIRVMGFCSVEACSAFGEMTWSRQRRCMCSGKGDGMSALALQQKAFATSCLTKVLCTYAGKTGKACRF